MGATGEVTRCLECGHVYPTRRALRREYRRAEWRYAWCYEPRWFLPFILLRLLFVRRVSLVTFCQECLHDL